MVTTTSISSSPKTPDSEKSIRAARECGTGGRSPRLRREHRSTNTAAERAVSDDEESSRSGNTTPKKRLFQEKPTKTGNATTKPDVVVMENFIDSIDKTVYEQRIDEKKAERLHECLQSAWDKVVFCLLCEQIPFKCNGKRYSCRVCLVPKKGHTCPYCHICSTPKKMFKKNDEHVCLNCPMCFDDGKKKKKLVQIKCEGHVCLHG